MGKGSHIHNWEKISEDQSGAILACADNHCPEMIFLEPEDAKKFDAAKATQTHVEIEIIEVKK
jgi:hypothetical protein